MDRREVGLFGGCTRIGEFDLLVCEVELNFAENKVAVSCTARSFAGKRIVGQGFDTDMGVGAMESSELDAGCGALGTGGGE